LTLPLTFPLNFAQNPQHNWRKSYQIWLRLLGYQTANPRLR